MRFCVSRRLYVVKVDGDKLEEFVHENEFGELILDQRDL